MSHPATPDQLASLLGVTARTVLAWARAGRIPSHRVGKAVWFDVEEVMAATKAPPPRREELAVVGDGQAAIARVLAGGARQPAGRRGKRTA